MSVAEITTPILRRLSAISPMGYAIGLHIRFAAPILTFFSYPDAWLAHYTANAYGLRDPLIGWGLANAGVVRWSALPVPDPFGIMAEAGQFGLRFGAAISCGPIASRSIAGFARSDREFTDAEIEALRANVQELHDLTEPPAALTRSQTEALRLIGDGHRYAAAAKSLGISESALKARLNAARTRLMARTLAEAVQRAKEFRLL